MYKGTNYDICFAFLKLEAIEVKKARCFLKGSSIIAFKQETTLFT